MPGLGVWEGALRARGTISFYPLATAPTLSSVADRGCFANKGVSEAFCQLVTYLSQGRSGWRDQWLSLTLPFQQVLLLPTASEEGEEPYQGLPPCSHSLGYRISTPLPIPRED